MYNGHRDAQSLKRWLQGFIPSPVTPLSSKEFRKEVLSKLFFLPWLINFYAPWCGHCVQFEPDFISIGQVCDDISFLIVEVDISQYFQKLEHHVRSGKVDCEVERVFCRELRVTSYPTVILYLSPNDKEEITARVPSEIVSEVKVAISRWPNRFHDELQKIYLF